MSTSAGAAFRRLGLWGLALMLAATALLAAAAVLQLRAVSHSEAQARAQLIADALAARVQRAVLLGIPLERLLGVDTLFAERMGDFPDIAALALAHADGRLLVLQAQPGAGALPEGPKVESLVLDRASRPAARVVLVSHETQLLRLVRPWALPLLALALLCATLANESLRLSLAAGVRRRERLVRAAGEAIAGGDFGARLPLLRRREFDLRPQWLAAQLRQLRERHLRVSRLVQSLRQTEPDAGRRSLLDQALDQARGADRFDEAAPLPDAAPTPARARWINLLLTVAAWLLALLPVLLAGPRAQAWGPAGWAGAVAVPFALLALALLARGPLARQPRPGMGLTGLVGLALGLLFVGPGLFMILVLALCPEVAWPREWPGDALAVWVCAGCLASLLFGGVAARLQQRLRPRPLPPATAQAGLPGAA